MRLSFTIGDLLWLTLVAALAVGGGWIIGDMSIPTSSSSSHSPSREEVAVCNILTEMGYGRPLTGDTRHQNTFRIELPRK
jgi:hypothetical protein